MHAAWYQVESISKKPFPHDPRELARDHQIYKDNVQAFLIAWRQWKKSLED